MNYNAVTQQVEFTLSSETMVVCPHCQSGWVILTVGIHDHQVEKMAVCTAKGKKSIYCPYCGGDMKITNNEVDYSVIPADCIRWNSRAGGYSHYCFSIPAHSCPETQGCQYSQFKPVWHRMKNRAEGVSKL